MKKIDLCSVKNGIVCFTFDDRNFEGWINALPLFEKYNAHASFFINGAIDDEAKAVITALKEKSHTVGLHTLTHADATKWFELYGKEAYFEKQIKPQLESFEFNSFGYPNNCRNEETDDFLSQYFSRFRAGIKEAAEEQIYVPINKLSENRVMHGIGIGEYYNTVGAELLEKIEHAAKTNTCVTFFSHNIAPNAGHINMPTELLESCLKKAQELGLSVIGLDEIP